MQGCLTSKIADPYIGIRASEPQSIHHPVGAWGFFALDSRSDSRCRLDSNSVLAFGGMIALRPSLRDGPWSTGRSSSTVCPSGAVESRPLAKRRTTTAQPAGAAVSASGETEMKVTLEERLKRRKLDALRRGVHRVGGEAALPSNVHLIGIGKAGVTILAEALNALEPSDHVTSALAIDIGDDGLASVRATIASLPAGRAHVDTFSLNPVGASVLADTFQNYERYLKLEYPFFPWALDGKGWLDRSDARLTSDGGASRAYAKALYGRAYYDGDRPLAHLLRNFGDRVGRERTQSIVAIVFGIGGGAGSGILVDLARHLTNVVLGRQALVVGIGILPCEGDVVRHRGGGLYATLNELDCLGDESKNAGVLASCGELFRNPFTAGLLLVPQQHVWCGCKSREETHARVNAEVASLLTARRGDNLLETLRMLNWVAAPSTQHSAARTPWGARWIHMFGFSDLEGTLLTSPDAARAAFGIGQSYKPEFIELRVPRPDTPEADSMAAKFEAIIAPEVTPHVAGNGRDGSVEFVLPSLSKADLTCFDTARAAYQSEDEHARRCDHSLLLEQGLILSEPSVRMPGMAGAAFGGSAAWTAVSLADLLGKLPGEENGSVCSA